MIFSKLNGLTATGCRLHFLEDCLTENITYSQAKLEEFTEGKTSSLKYLTLLKAEQRGLYELGMRKMSIFYTTYFLQEVQCKTYLKNKLHSLRRNDDEGNYDQRIRGR